MITAISTAGTITLAVILFTFSILVFLFLSLSILPLLLSGLPSSSPAGNLPAGLLHAVGNIISGHRRLASLPSSRRQHTHHCRSSQAQVHTKNQVVGRGISAC